MRGSEVNINLSEMKEWTSALKSSDTMKIIALENGDIAMGAELRKSMSEKMADAWKIKLYATDDMKILAVHPDINSDFRYPKNGRRKFKSYVESLKNKGYKIPATYNVEWNEKIQSWVEENIRMFIVMDDEIEIKKHPLFLRDIKHLRREHRSVIEIAEEIAGIIKQM